VVPDKAVPAKAVPAKAVPAKAVPAARGHTTLLASRHPVLKDTYWFPENGFVVDKDSKSVVGKCVDDKVLPLTEEDETECRDRNLRVGIPTTPPAKVLPLHVAALGLVHNPIPTTPPAEAPPAEVLPLHVAALGLVHNPVDELKMDALTVTDNAKPFGECEKCKKKFKIEGKCYQKHYDNCGKVGYVDPDDTISEGGTGMG
jgi:hypothetical protein